MTKVAVVGLGYVGLPLALGFGEVCDTVGFDLNADKINSYIEGIDPAGEAITADFANAKCLTFTHNPMDITAADFIIVAVPTPIDTINQPDFSHLITASELVARHMKQKAVIVFESTVYPGATEEVCVPVLEKVSGKKWQQDFFVGYSPERINPSDKEHTLKKITKVVSGDSPKTLEQIAALYEKIIDAGVYKASSIKVAEAAKVIENIQRDLNIALMNELAIIFDKLEIDTMEVLQAAGTKWNFLPFRPGLVGGHCIGVDPYYLTHKAAELKYHPEVILAGRRINDSMGKFIVENTIKHIAASGFLLRDAKVNILGLTFKENCADIRNSKVPVMIKELREYNIDVAVCDPLVDSTVAQETYDINLTPWDKLPKAHAIILAVAHDDFLARGSDVYADMLVANGVIIDVKSVLNQDLLTQQELSLWRL